MPVPFGIRVKRLLTEKTKKYMAAHEEKERNRKRELGKEGGEKKRKFIVPKPLLKKHINVTANL
ncbi:unnamed protein product [Clavelina lepadiformis]|uniref:Uncharacterized protein n=1 Tax=Clavelina lepadiformis TaxID=159417 RepID=A0ABP0GHK6_CLALP